VVDGKGNTTRFAFARNGGADGADMARLALRRCGASLPAKGASHNMPLQKQR
jgi:hypothetical protein